MSPVTICVINFHYDTHLLFTQLKKGTISLLFAYILKYNLNSQNVKLIELPLILNINH